MYKMTIKQLGYCPRHNMPAVVLGQVDGSVILPVPLSPFHVGILIRDLNGASHPPHQWPYIYHLVLNIFEKVQAKDIKFIIISAPGNEGLQSFIHCRINGSPMKLPCPLDDLVVLSHKFHLPIHVSKGVIKKRKGEVNFEGIEVKGSIGEKVIDLTSLVRDFEKYKA